MILLQSITILQFYMILKNFWLHLHMCEYIEYESE